jgi:hypothetical protein
MPVELQVTTHYSFLRGASSPEELFATASLLGLGALAVTDRNSLAGMVRAHAAAKPTGAPASWSTPPTGPPMAGSAGSSASGGRGTGRRTAVATWQPTTWRPGARA